MYLRAMEDPAWVDRCEGEGKGVNKEGAAVGEMVGGESNLVQDTL